MQNAVAIFTLMTIVASAGIGRGRADDLSAAGTSAPESVTQVCTTCHGANGNSTRSGVPSLAGQTAGYLQRQLEAFQSQRRVGVMSAVSMGLSKKAMHDEAVYFARQKPNWQATAPGPRTRSIAGLGRSIWVDGIAVQRVPACASCHALDGGGLPPEFPRLAGQHAPYLASQLRAFRSDSRMSNPDRMMRDLSARLSDADIDAVADYAAAMR